MNNMKKKSMSKARSLDRIFYISMVGLPFIMYVLMTFIPGYFYIFIFVSQKYDPYTGTLYFQPDIFYNIRTFIQEIMFQDAWKIAFKNSITLWLTGIAMLPLGLFTSFYVGKKMPGTSTFRFILLMPGMISGMIWVLLFKNYAERALPDLLSWPYGPLSDVEKQFPAVVIYGIWMGLAGNLLIHSNIISGVSPELIDAGKVDGLNLVGEFLHISFPHLYPVLMISLIGIPVGFLTQSGSVFEFYGLDTDSRNYTIGFLMFQKVMKEKSVEAYGFNAAGSLLFALIAMPVTLTTKWALERFGPSEDEPTNRKFGRAKQ